MLRREDMQRRLTDLRNGLVASDSSTLKLSTSFSGQRRCMFFDIDYKMILNHLWKVNDFAKKNQIFSKETAKASLLGLGLLAASTTAFIRLCSSKL